MRLEFIMLSLAVGLISHPAPLIHTAEGSVTAIDLKPQGAHLTLHVMNDAPLFVEIDALTTSLWKGNSRIDLTDLKFGDKVRIRYVEKDHQNIAKTVEIF